MISNFLNELAKLLNQGWVGALIGLFSLLLAVYLYRLSQVFPRLAVQMSNTRLIGGRHAELPNNVTIYYQRDLSQPTKTEVSQLTKTTIVLWNAGKTTFRENDIVSGDPLRFEFESNSQILDSKITLVTRDANLFAIHEDSTKSYVAICKFDFLDPQDGVRIEILHTSDERPTMYGTIRGLPQGCTDWGSLPIRGKQLNSRNGKSKLLLKILGISNFVYFFAIIFSVSMIAVGLFPDLFLTLLPRLGRVSQTEPLLQQGKVNWTLVSFGIVYAILPVLLLWFERRRFPKRLAE
jgi:amino acid transporter